MHVFRLCSKHYGILDGEGARLYGGRWNSIGIPLVYTSEHLSLCLLEQLVHLNMGTIPLNWVSLKIEIPKKAKGETIQVFPKTELESKQIGDRWVQTNKSLFLKVPSYIIPTEFNVLINPHHPAMKDVNVSETKPFTLDSRLLK